MLKLVKLDDQTLPGIAEAIRSRNGETADMLPSAMAAKIRAIPGAKPEQDKTLDPVTVNQTVVVEPDAGMVLKKVTVPVQVAGGGTYNSAEGQVF